MNASGKARIYRVTLLVLVLAGVFAFWRYYEHDYASGFGPVDSIAFKKPPPAPSFRMPTSVFHKVGEKGISRNAWPTPRSRWLENRRNTAERELGHVDLVVLPVQGDYKTFDPIERSVLSRLVSDAIQQSGDVSVANPDLVLRYLGTHFISFADADVAKLAKTTRAGHVLALHATQNGDRMWSLHAVLDDPDYPEVRREKPGKTFRSLTRYRRPSS